MLVLHSASNVLDRLASLRKPVRIARSLAVAATTVAVAPVLLMIALVAFGAIVGMSLAETTSGAVAWGASITVIVVVIGVAALLVGIVAVARVYSGDRYGSALLAALRVLPRLAVLLVAIVAAILVSLLAWPVLVVGMLVVALVLRLRRRSGVRVALLAAIPFVPTIVGLALVPAALGAATAKPTSLRALVLAALEIVRHRRLRLLGFVIAAALLSAGFSWVGTAASIALDSAGRLDQALLVIALSLTLLIVATGAALSVLLPPPSSPTPLKPVRSRRAALLARVAVVVTLSVLTSMLPVVTTSTPASADALITPMLTLGMDGFGPSPMLSVEVTVPAGDPSGSVQFYDGTTPIGAPTRVVPSGYEPTLGRAFLAGVPAFDPGDHEFSFVFTPDSPLVESGLVSSPHSWHFTATTELTITVDAAAGVGSPAEVTVTVLANYPTAVTPTGTVLIEWDADSAEVAIVDGVAHYTTPVLEDSYISASYAGSTDFTAASDFIRAGVVLPPDDTVITAEVYNPPHVLGTELVAAAMVEAPLAAWDTVVKGSVLVWEGTTLLTASDVGHGLVIPTTNLHAGPNTLRFEFAPAYGFTGSETTVDLTIEKASTTVSTTVSDASTAWGDPLSLSVNVASSLDGDRSVEVWDTRTDSVVGLQTVTVSGGVGTASIDFTGGLRPAAYSLVATVVGDDDHAEASAAPVAISVSPAVTTTTISVTPSPAEVGAPVTVTALVTAAGVAIEPTGWFTFRFPDSSQQVVDVVAGRASAEWIPTTPFTGDVIVSFFDDTFQFAGSGKLQSLVVSAAVAPAPTVEWTGTLTPADRTVTLTYAAAAGRDIPTGSVRILDTNGVILTSAPLVDGVASIPIYGTVGAHPVLRAVYLGDYTYGVRDDVLPVDTLTNYLPVAAVGAPETADLGTAFAVTVTVNDVPAGLIDHVTVVSTDRNGVTSTVGTATVNGFGEGTANVTLLIDGENTLKAYVTFTSASELTPITSPPATVTVAPVPVPSLVVTTPTPSSSLVAGAAIDVDVTAAWIGDGTTGVPAGTTAEVRDAGGALLGTVTLLGAIGVDGYRGRLHLTNVHGGPLSLHAVVTYGPLNATATSAALELVIAPPSTVLIVQATLVEVGTPATVDVTAYPLGGFSGATRSVAATVTANGIDYPVTLTRTTATAPFAGLLTVPTAHAGIQTITASTAGNGVDVAAASDDFLMSVNRRTTALSVRVIQATAAGEDVIVFAQLTQSGTGTSPAPTGDVVVTSQRSLASCVVGADYTCTIPGNQVFAGANAFTVRYAGDAENFAASGETSHTVGPRTSRIDLQLSPADGWVSGEPVTATWTTTTSSRPASGTVYVSIAGQSCSAPAAAGSCTVTLRSSATVAPVSAAYRVVFLSNDDAPGAEVTGTKQMELCAYPYFVGTVDYLSARHCGEVGQGLVTGSTVRLTATNVPARYVVDHWTSDGSSIPGATPVVTVRNSATFYPVYRYEPKCFTLTISPSRIDRVTNGGFLSAATLPNCADANTPTSAELADLAAGKPRYAAGTVVLLTIVANQGEPKVILDAITGTTLLNDRLAEVTMSKDRAVAVTFKVEACTAVAIFPTEGGTVTVTKAVRPSSSATFLPATGECISYDGRPGYVPGTKLTFTAKPDAESTLYSWSADTDWPAPGPEDARVVATASKPTTSTVSTTYDYLVGAARPSIYAHFAQVKCVAVTLVSRSIVSEYYTISEAAAPKGIVGKPWDTESKCGGIADKRTVTFSANRRYRIVTEVKSYVATGRLDVTAPAAIYQPVGANIPNAYVLWETSIGQGSQRLLLDDTTSASNGVRAGLTAYEMGPMIDLSLTPAAVTVTGRWVIIGCVTARVSTPQGGSYILDPQGTEEQRVCEYADEMFYYGPYLTLRALKPVGAPNLTPMLSSSDGSSGPTPRTVLPDRSYILEYCTPLGLDLRILNDVGVATVATTAQIAALIADDGECPNGWTRPNRTTRTALSPAGVAAYTVVGNPAGYGPTRTVDALGNVSGPNRMDLKVICYTLDVNDASITTPGNCPGGASNRFVRGSQVQLQAEEADRFDGWINVDAQQGETAWVIMDQNRYVEGDIYNYSWYEEIGNALSSVAQRALAAIVTVATGIVLAEAYLVRAAGWVLQGTIIVLHAAGVNGSVVDALEDVSNVLEAQFDVMNLLADCVTGAATGGSPPLLDVPVPTGSSPMPSGGSSAQAQFDIAKATLQQQLNDAGISSLPGASLLGDAGDMINIFGSGSYTGAAGASWSSFGSSIADCTQAGVQHYVDTSFR